MQRNPIELGAFHHELIGGAPVLKKAVAKDRVGGRGHPARNLAQWTSHCFHRTSLRPLRRRDEAEGASGGGGGAVFCPFPDSPLFTIVVAAQRRGGRRQRS